MDSPKALKLQIWHYVSNRFTGIRLKS